MNEGTEYGKDKKFENDQKMTCPKIDRTKVRKVQKHEKSKMTKFVHLYRKRQIWIVVQKKTNLSADGSANGSVNWRENGSSEKGVRIWTNVAWIKEN